MFEIVTGTSVVITLVVGSVVVLTFSVLVVGASGNPTRYVRPVKNAMEMRTTTMRANNFPTEFAGKRSFAPLFYWISYLFKPRKGFGSKASFGQRIKARKEENCFSFCFSTFPLDFVSPYHESIPLLSLAT